jgi:hypothetical protein
MPSTPLKGSNTMQMLEPRIYASKVLGENPVKEDFVCVEVEGVRVFSKDAAGNEEIVVDNVAPQFISVYVRHKDGRALAVADFGSHAEASAYGRQLAARYEWAFECPLSL